MSIIPLISQRAPKRRMPMRDNHHPDHCCGASLVERFVRSNIARVMAIALCALLLVASHATAQEELVNMVLDLIGEDDKDMRSIGFDQIRTEAKGEESTKQFAAALTKLNPESQVGLLKALADRGDAAALDNIKILLKETADEDVQVAAIECIGSLGGPDDTQVIIEKLNSTSSKQVAAAKRALEQLKSPAISGILATASKKGPTSVQVALIELLAARRAFDEIDTLLEHSKGRDATVRAAAMTSLGKIARQQDVPEMARSVLIAEKGRERIAAEKNVMIACQRIEDVDARGHAVLKGMSGMDSQQRIDMLSCLGRVGGKHARDAIENYLRSREARKRAGGINAFCNWPDSTIAPRLLELANTVKRPEHRIALLRAVMRIAPLPDDRADEERLQLLKKAMKMATRDSERKLAIQRARAIRHPDSLRYVLGFFDDETFTEDVCLSIVELAHHRELRESAKDEFFAALDKVMETSKDEVVVDRARRYKNNQTWVRPK